MSQGKVPDLFARLSNKSSIPKKILDSQRCAWSSLISRACGMPADAVGNLDPEEYYIDVVKSSGTAFGIGGLREFIGGTRLVFTEIDLKKTSTAIPLWEKNTIWDDEKRLNKFLKRLGRALEVSHHRDVAKGFRWPYNPDWEKNVDKVDSIIVKGWCDPILYNKIRLPPLCGFTIPALHKLFQLLKPQVITANVTLESFRKRVSRLGLLCIPGSKVTHVSRDSTGGIKLS